jgi:DNA-binding CsgD family transcriptional regulator
MTRLLYLPDDVTVIQLEVNLSPAQLCAAVNAGMRPVGALRSAPPGKLCANEMGGTVIVIPANKRMTQKKASTVHNGLSRRQVQVHELSIRGLTSGEIAVMLHLSRRTVNYHLNKVKNRLRFDESPQMKLLPMPLNFEGED